MGSFSRKIKRNSEVRAKARSTRRCPACNDKVTIATTSEGDIILHPEPFCSYFIHTDADEYAREVFSHDAN